MESGNLELQYFLSGITKGSIYAVVAIGFNLIYSATGVLNFAQGEFVMLGGMVAVTLARFVPLPVALAGAVGRAGRLPLEIYSSGVCSGIKSTTSSSYHRLAIVLQEIACTYGTKVRSPISPAARSSLKFFGAAISRRCSLWRPWRSRWSATLSQIHLAGPGVRAGSSGEARCAGRDQHRKHAHARVWSSATIGALAAA